VLSATDITREVAARATYSTSPSSSTASELDSPSARLMLFR
jgi:hypothetical protein